VGEAVPDEFVVVVKEPVEAGDNVAEVLTARFAPPNVVVFSMFPGERQPCCARSKSYLHYTQSSTTFHHCNPTSRSQHYLKDYLAQNQYIVSTMKW